MFYKILQFNLEARALCYLIFTIPSFLFSFSLVWPSYTIKLLKSDQTPLEGRFGTFQEGLLGSLLMLGCFVSTPLVGYVVDDLGRKKTLLLAGAVSALSFCVICTARNVTTLLIGRFILGLGGGLHMGAATMMLGEISEVSIRGCVSAMISCMYTIGMLTSYIMGWVCSYDCINYLLLTLCVFYLVLLTGLKESPIFLMKIQENNKAIESLKFYRGEKVATKSILDEIAAIKISLQSTNPGTEVNTSSENEKLNGGDDVTKKAEDNIVTRSAWEHLKASKSSQRALITGCIITSLMVFMGTSAVQSYAGQIFEEAIPGMSSDLCSIVLAVAVIFGTFLSASLCDLFGRRNLMLSSCFLVVVLQILLSSMIRWSWAPEWMFPLVIIVYSFSFQFGAGCVPLLLSSELFTPEVKALSTVIFMCALWISNFILLAVYGFGVQVFGIDGMFFIFAIVAAIEMIVSYLILPETAGLSTEDIQDKFAKGYIQVKRK